MSAVIDLLSDLIQRPSVTPEDEGCQNLLIQHLQSHGFVPEHMPFEEVSNLWLRKGQEAPVFCFAGHTDVVPTGDPEHWTYPPFDAQQVDGMLYGRGAADMKGSIAAFVEAAKQFVSDYPDHKGSIALLITSDEEGPSKNGTVKVVETLQARNEQMDWVVVGEPTSGEALGDTIKNGRRGSLGGVLTVHGKQGHVAYPHLADNPVHKSAPFIAELTQQVWDQGNPYFPATSFQISNISAGTGATNVIPADLHMTFNWRFSTEQSPEQLKKSMINLLEKHSLEYSVEWNLSGMPFLTEPGRLIDALIEAIDTEIGKKPELSTTGGTSDGRFIAPTGAEVVEFGPLNRTIHQIDECVATADIERLQSVYYRLLVNLLT